MTKVYGAALPALTASYTGLAAGDTAASLTTPPTLSTTATASSPVVAGRYPITASGAVDPNYEISYAPGTLTVTPATPTLSLSAPGGTFDGSPFAASVTVAGSGNDATPAASLDDIAPVLTYYLGSCTLGTSLGSIPPADPGTYTVLATFPGTNDYTATQSAPVTFATGMGVPTIALASSADSAVVGQAVTLVATVTAAGTPSGTVTFSDGATLLATVPIDGSGKATLTSTGLAIGPHSITVTYSGDADFLAMQSGPVTESVAPATTEVVLVPHPVFGTKKLKSLGLTAEIAPVATGGGVPTGIVTFELLVKHRKKIEAHLLGTSALNRGEATLTLKPKQVLNKTITIIYNGDPNYRANTVTTPKLTQKGLKSLARPTATVAGLGR